MSICMCCLAGLVSIIDRSKGIQIAAVFFTFAFNFFFPIALLAVAFLYTVEIVPLEIRAQSTGIAVSGNWLMNFMVAEVTPTGYVLQSLLPEMIYDFYFSNNTNNSSLVLPQLDTGTTSSMHAPTLPLQLPSISSFRKLKVFLSKTLTICS